MKFAREVNDLLMAFPGREFRMVHLVRHVSGGRKLDRRERHAIKVGIWRVLQALVESGVVATRPPSKIRGGTVFYRWKVSHEAIAERH